MCLTSFVTEPNVAARVKPFRPPVKVTANLLIPPASPRPRLIGTAFDYLLRFELQRRYPTAEDARWTAEGAAGCIYQKLPNGSRSFDPFPLDSPHWQPAKRIATRCTEVVTAARAVLADYLRQPSPDERQQLLLATVAVQLAKLDAVVRGRTLEPEFESADPADVDELMRLLAVVPFDRLAHPGRMLLNPTFPAASEAVGAADADLITGGLLVDIKTIKVRTPPATALDQLFGYFLLARRARQADPTFPEVNSVGIYSSRYAALWTYDTRGWTERPEFAETERWFFEWTSVRGVA